MVPFLGDRRAIDGRVSTLYFALKSSVAAMKSQEIVLQKIPRNYIVINWIGLRIVPASKAENNGLFWNQA